MNDKLLQSLTIIKELFVIPDENNYILYAPIKQSVLMVNSAAVLALQKFNKGERDALSSHKKLLDKLTQAGILISKKDANHQNVSFPNDKMVFNPTGISLFLTNKCSMRCIYCYSKGGHDSKTMSWETAKTAIDWIFNHAANQKINHFFINFHGGGEVTMAMNLMKKCVQYIRKQENLKGIKVQLEAGLNGVMNDKTTDWVVENLNGATLSIDGLPEIQNSQRPLANGKDSFEKVSSTLKRMDEKGFKYGIRTTLTNIGLKFLTKSVEFICKEYNAENIQIEPFFQVGRALTNNLSAVDSKEFVKQFNKASIIADSYGKKLKYSGARFGTITNTFCKAVGNSFGVTPDAYITSCYEVTNKEDLRAPLFFYGKIDPSGKVTLNHQKIKKLLTLSVENKPYCKNCFCKWHCAGDCPAKLASMGDPWDTSNNSRCYINQAITKEQIKKILVDATK